MTKHANIGRISLQRQRERETQNRGGKVNAGNLAAPRPTSAQQANVMYFLVETAKERPWNSRYCLAFSLPPIYLGIRSEDFSEQISDQYGVRRGFWIFVSLLLYCCCCC